MLWHLKYFDLAAPQHELHAPWWWSAQWFEYLLLDYDVVSNWGNRAYIVGVGADSRTGEQISALVRNSKLAYS